MQPLSKGPSMPRSILDETHIHPAIRDRVASHQQAIVREVQTAVVQHAVVVVGMGLNPFPKKARKLLDAAGVPTTTWNTATTSTAGANAMR
jgi:acyl-CoA synthetase (NDP forming)